MRHAWRVTTIARPPHVCWSLSALAMQLAASIQGRRHRSRKTGGTMPQLNENRPIRPSSDRMHPGIYLAMIGLLSLYAVSAWILFGGDYYNDLTFAVVSGLFVMAV